MRSRISAVPQRPPVVEHFAKEFARFLNNVQNDAVDSLGSFLIENEWENYRKDAEEVMESLKLAGFVVVSRTASEAMIQAADQALSKGLMGSGAVNYVNAVWGAMLTEWVVTRNDNLILDIFSMALSRASNPGARDVVKVDSSFQRFRKQSQEILSGLEKTGMVVAPDEATQGMITAGVLETAEQRTQQKVGAEPDYIASLYINMIAARSD